MNTRWFIPGLICVTTIANAQSQKSELRLRIQDGNGSPITGALVALLDQNDQPITEGLSSSDGYRLLTAVPGSYRVRVRRVGFSPYVSEPITIPRSGSLILRVETPRIALNTVLVLSRSGCRQLESDAGALGMVWAEVVKALQTSQLTLADLGSVGRARIYTKETGTNGEVLRAESTTISLTNQRPFGIADPADLGKRGYVRGDVYRGWEFFGPDERVLLSPEFATTHCFNVVRESSRRGQIGLGFKPIPKRTVSDIQGVLWLDEGSAQLREIVFEYTKTGLPLQVPAGGQTKFRRFPSGAWLVEEWKLSMPRIEMRRIENEQFRVHSSSFQLAGFAERGGALILDSDDVSIDADKHPGTNVTGTIFDSLQGRPLTSAVVTLDDVSVRSDGEGRFRFVDVGIGNHRVSFSHPSLRSLGLTAVEKEIQVTAMGAELYLAVPSLGAAWPRICHDTASTRRGNDRRGVLHGIVRDVLGNPVDGARVRVTWREDVSLVDLRGMARFQQPDLRLDVTTDNAGQFSACGFSSKSSGIVEAIVGRRPAARSPFDFARGSVLQRDLIVPDTVKKRVATISGIISDVSNRAIPDVYIFDRVNERSVVTDGRGTFRIEVQPVGGVTPLSIRHAGVLGRDTVLAMGIASAVTLQVSLKPATGTDSITPDEPSIGYFVTLDRNGFYRRRSNASGTFMTMQEIAAHNPSRITDLFRDVPGVDIVSPEGTSGDADFPVSEESGCPLTLLVDGRRAEYDRDHFTSTKEQSRASISPLSQSSTPTPVPSADPFTALVPPDLVAGLELYPAVSTIPVEFQRHVAGCGLIVVWTRSP